METGEFGSSVEKSGEKLVVDADRNDDGRALGRGGRIHGDSDGTGSVAISQLGVVCSSGR